MHFSKERLVSSGSLVYKSLGFESGQLGLTIGVEIKKPNFPYYIVITDDGKVSTWMTLFVEVINES